MLSVLGAVARVRMLHASRDRGRGTHSRRPGGGAAISSCLCVLCSFCGAGADAPITYCVQVQGVRALFVALSRD